MGAGAAVINGHEGFTGRDTQEGSCVGCACSGGWGVRRGEGQGGCLHWRGLQHARGCACCVGDSDVWSICVLKEEGGEGGGGGAMVSLTTTLAPGLGRRVAHKLQQEDRDREVARCCCVKVGDSS
jgi:hypothetical protein